MTEVSQQLTVITQDWQTTILEDLEKRKIPPTKLTTTCRMVSPEETKEITNFKHPSLEFIYRDFNGLEIPSGNRYKLYIPDEVRAKSKKRLPKYMGVKDAEPQLYLSPLLSQKTTWEEVSKDVSKDIIISEGEFKAITATMFDFIVVSISGVWSFMSTKHEMPFLPALNEITWADGSSRRAVYLSFDADIHTNANVYKALHTLASQLTARGANVYISVVPVLDGDKGTGLDDFLIHPSGGPDKYEKMLAEAPAFACCETLIQLNQEVSYLQNPGLVIRRDTDRMAKAWDFCGHQYSNRYYYETTQKGALIKKKAAPAWLDWEGRSELAGLTYAPGKDKILPGKHWNLWSGWGVEPVQGSIAPWTKLLDSVFKGSVRHRTWFEQWAAFPLQNPGIKLFTAVVIWAAQQGNGKTLIGNTLGMLHGASGTTHNYIEVGNAELHSSFNQWAKNKTLIHCDEITGTDNMTRHDRFKKLITQTKQQINEKGIGGYEIPDCAAWYFTSNNPNALYLEAMDRRFFIWELIGALPEEFFFEEYGPWLEGGGPSHLMYHLMNLDLTGFNPHARAPHTAFKQAMIEDSKGIAANWIIRLGNLDNDLLSGVPPECDLFTAHQLLTVFKATVDDSDHVHAVTFSNLLKKTGFRQLPPILMHGHPTRLYAVRQPQYWSSRVEADIDTAKKEIKAHFTLHFPDHGRA